MKVFDWIEQSELIAEQKKVLKSVGPKLIPFFKTVAVFFVLFGENSASSFFCCIIKCLPVLALIYFVLLDGMNLSEEYKYARRILIGLIFSLCGDALLVWNYFEYGLLSFAIGHLMYTVAFGFKSRDLRTFCIGAVTAVLSYAYIAPGLKGILCYLVPLYVALIFTMAWRATAHVGKMSSWTKQCRCAGAIFFVISDFIIAVTKFVHPIHASHTIIMATYYTAQLFIALSVVDSQVDVILENSLEDSITDTSIDEFLCDSLTDPLHHKAKQTEVAEVTQLPIKLS